jgi:hypothetical protein
MYVLYFNILTVGILTVGKATPKTQNGENAAFEIALMWQLSTLGSSGKGCFFRKSDTFRFHHFSRSRFYETISVEIYGLNNLILSNFSL